MERGERITSGRRRGKRRRTRLQRLIVSAVVLLLAVGGFQLLKRPIVTASAQMRAAFQDIFNTGIPVSPPPEPPQDPSTDRQRVLARAFELIGLPYEWGAKGPDEYDCSGLTTEAYAAGGFALPDGSYNQAQGEQPLDVDALQPADLILYRWSEDGGVEHVTLYIGDGWVIGTGSPGHAGLAALYPLADDLDDDGRVLTYRHVTFPDER